MKQSFVGVMLLFCLIAVSGCEDASDTAGGSDSSSGSTPSASTTSSGDSSSGITSASSSSAFDMGSVKWLDSNVSGWPATSSLSVSIGGGTINLKHSKASSWPGVAAAGASVNANAWIFVNQGGTWYAATWEWLRVGQTAKSTAAVSGSHIKKSPLQNFQPVSGETYGFMVSGLVRLRSSNVQERSNVVMRRWP